MSETGTGPAEPGETLGRYRLLRKIARGGMAEVFAARSFGAHGFEKTVAIKRILPRYGNDPQFVRMMVDEAKITVLLNHPNVATILELCEQDGDYFIVMEFVPGQSLSSLGKRLRERGERLGVLEACFVVVELLQGLQAAHVQKESSGKPAHIIHRDVSPQNVLLSFDGHVKVIDFGIARAMHRLEMTEVGTIKGKLRYLAPEMIDPGRFMKSGDFDHRVDVFAAGIVLWELLAARTLYQGDDEMVVYDAITDSDAPDLAALGMCDAALARIVARALTRDPEARYLTAEDFADDLRAYVYRNDPAFTHKRLAAVLERLFPVEKQEMLALERGVVPGLPGGAPRPAPRQERDDRDHPRIEAAVARPPSEPAVEGALAREKPLPAPEPRQVAPDDPTRTQAVSGEASARGREGRSEQPRSAPRSEAPANPTRQMRAGDSSKKLRPGEAAPPSSSRKAVMPVGDDERGPAQGDVLTVMTLVSRSSAVAALPSEGASPAAASAASDEGTSDSVFTRSPRGRSAADFLVGGETLTVNEGAPGPAASRHASSTAAAAPAPSARPAVTDETPHTRERSRSLAREQAPARRPRVLLAAVAGIGVAAIAGVAFGIMRPAKPAPPADVAPAAVKVVITSAAPGASATALGVEVPVPATFSAIPGDSLEVLVRAPGHTAESVRVSIPRVGAGDRTLDVVLRAEPVPLFLEIEPAAAEAFVDDAPYQPGMLVAVGRPVMLRVSAPGFQALKREIEAKPGVERRERIELTPEVGDGPVLHPRDALAPPDPRVDPKPKARDAKPAVVKMATLVLRTKDVWGQVTIDGKTYEEVTPLTVELKAGRHNVVVAHPPKGHKKSFSVTLKPGETLTRTVEFD